VRRAAVKALQGQVSEAQLPLIDNAIAKEGDGKKSGGHGGDYDMY
jgi:hypothetical protein